MKRVGDRRPVGKGNRLDGRSVPQSENHALQAQGKGKRTLGGGYRGGFLSWHVAAEAGIKASATFKARGCTFAAGENCRASAMADGIRRPDLHNPHKNERDKLLV
jgi:hypothetical protein